MVLNIPPANGVYYKWKAGDTLEGVAWRVEYADHSSGLMHMFLPEFVRGTADKTDLEGTQPSESLLAMCAVTDVNTTGAYMNRDAMAEWWGLRKRLDLIDAHFVYPDGVGAWLAGRRLGIPVVFHEECLHGQAAIDATSFSQPIGLGATFDPELVRRLFEMTAEEARAFLADAAPDKRAKLIDRLLERPEFADFWALKWSDLLRNEEKTLDRKGVQNFHAWIRGSIARLDRFESRIARQFHPRERPFLYRPVRRKSPCFFESTRR